MKVSNITFNNSWCKFCANLCLCENPDCESCFNKSFASSDFSDDWSEKNIKTPRQINKYSHKKFHFCCRECGYEFLKDPHHITLRNSTCALCSNPTEKEFYLFIKNIYLNVYHQFVIKNNKKIKNRKYDFLLVEEKIIIELDEYQHFYPKGREADILKMKSALKAGYSIIRITYMMTKKDETWKSQLIETIEKLRNLGTPQVIHLDNKNRYKIHKQLME